MFRYTEVRQSKWNEWSHLEFHCLLILKRKKSVVFNVATLPSRHTFNYMYYTNTTIQQTLLI